MSLEQNIYDLRKQKLAQIEALGQPAYPHKFEFTHQVSEVLAQFGPHSAEQLEAEHVSVCIAGRLMAIRLMGKASFAHLQQAGERLQLYVRKDAIGEQAWSLWKLLDLGDHIGASGYLFRTRTGELSLHVETLTFLAKDLLPLPEKFHGLTDVELRYRQRYVDLLDPEVRQTFIKRAKIVQSIRRFLDTRSFVEVETPMMHAVAGGAAARPFVTHHNALDIDLYMRVAPELYLKRLVVGGLDRVFEINRNFRNEGISTRHNPEFTMLEFYQAYADYHTLMDLTEELLQQVAMDVNGTLQNEFNGRTIDWSHYERLSMREAIRKYWPINGAGPSDEELSDIHSLITKLKEVVAALQQSIAQTPVPSSIQESTLTQRRLAAELDLVRRGLENDVTAGYTDCGKAISTLFEFVAEGKLWQPTFIYDFPLSVSPLSKNKSEEPDFVERFEIYVAGMELGNAFSELNDPEEQRRRFEQQLAERARGDEEAHQMDEDYIRALSYGLPPTGGEGIGIDRLTMMMTGETSIRDVILFPLLRPEKKDDEEAK